MALTPEQISDLKDQLRDQVKHLPESQRQQAEEQISDLSEQALEAMLSEERGKRAQTSKKTIFRSIVDGDVSSIIVEENKVAKAVMDITPISKGHVLIIPINPVSDAKYLPVGAFSLAKKVALRISKKLQSKSNLIQTETKFGESVVHVIPSYGEKKDLSSDRTTAKKEDLEMVASQIRVAIRKPKPKKIKIEKKPSPSSYPQMRRRIP